jgi:hypothetical protein
MLDRTATKFSHVKPGDTQFVSGGLRDFFLYRDLGIADATNGKVIAHLVKANMAPETGTGWHRHEADFQIVIMTKGWAKFMYEDKETRHGIPGNRRAGRFQVDRRRPRLRNPAPHPLEITDPHRIRSRIRSRSR